MFSRHRFLQGTVGVGLGGPVLAKLANQHSLTESGTPASHPSGAVIFEMVRTRRPGPPVVPDRRPVLGPCRRD